ncbi:Calcineurin-binding protein cabin-1, partial [Ophiophagus hannah]
MWLCRIWCRGQVQNPWRGWRGSFQLSSGKAVLLDSTDVNLWYKIGHVALRLTRLPLARHAFEEGLACNPDHWPCLDNLITVLYTLSDYTTLERDNCYSKGLVIKEKIFE